MENLIQAERILLKYVYARDVRKAPWGLYVEGQYRVDMSDEDVSRIVGLGFCIQYNIQCSNERTGLLYYETKIFNS